MHSPPIAAGDSSKSNQHDERNKKVEKSVLEKLFICREFHPPYHGTMTCHGSVIGKNYHKENGPDGLVLESDEIFHNGENNANEHPSLFLRQYQKMSIKI